MILARNVQPSIMISTPPVSAGVNAIVAGAGTAAVNGTYTPRGTNEGKPYYNLEGQPDSLLFYAIIWSAPRWYLYNDDALYDSADEDTTYPWEVSGWVQDVGDAPAPTVTQG